MELKNLKHYHKNPRKITETDFAKLSETLKKYGDLSGIVVNVRTGEVIGGNQRTRFFKQGDSEIVISDTYEKPSDVGTTATGYVLHEGERFAYREVDWDEKTAEGANIVANKAGGMWDFDMLANQFDTELLLDSGFKDFELSFPNKSPDSAQGGSGGGEPMPSEETNLCPTCGQPYEPA